MSHIDFPRLLPLWSNKNTHRRQNKNPLNTCNPGTNKASNFASLKCSCGLVRPLTTLCNSQLSCVNVSNSVCFPLCLYRDTLQMR